MTDARLYLNLACAYGQLYRHLLRTSPEAAAELKAAKDGVVAIKETLRRDAAWRRRLQQLLEHDAPGKDAEDNDLEPFEFDAEVRAAIGLPPKAPPPAPAP